MSIIHRYKRKIGNGLDILLDPSVQQTSAVNAANIRRDTDDAEQVIGYLSNVYDIASHDAFVGAGNGFIETLYDQYAKVDVSQATGTLQSKFIKDGFGSGLHSFEFVNGADPFGDLKQLSGTIPVEYDLDGEYTIFAVAKINAAYSLGNTICAIGRPNNVNILVQAGRTAVGTNNIWMWIQSVSGTFEVNANSVISTGNVFLVTIERVGSSGNWTYNIRVNGTQVATDTTTYNAYSNNRSFRVGNYNIIEGAAASIDGQIAMTGILFENNETLRNSIETDLISRYGL